MRVTSFTCEPSSIWQKVDRYGTREREGNRPWNTHRIKKGPFFLTSGGAPYECRWKALTSEPFESLFVFVELPLLQRSLEEVFGDDAPNARLKDLSAFTDVALSSLMERLRDELVRRKASPLFVQGIAQAIALHLARNYAETVKEARSGGPALPGFKLRQITDWMAEHAADDFNLDQLGNEQNRDFSYLLRFL